MTKTEQGAWVRLSAPGNKLGATWEHPSGWQVHHCGHPTANWPYYAVDPTDNGRLYVTHNGKGFRTLVAAFAAVEGVLVGELVATDEGCGPTTGRIASALDLQNWRRAWSTERSGFSALGIASHRR